LSELAAVLESSSYLSNHLKVKTSC